MTTIIGDPDNNELTATSAADRIFGLAGSDTLSGNAGNDALLNGNQGDDFVFGGFDDDILRGGQGNDFVSGDRGNDILYGDRGNDILYGGGDRDIFVLSGADADTIADFEDGIDAIGLVGRSFADLSLTATGGGTTIADNRTGTPLALVLGISPDALTAADFTADVTPSPFINGIASGDTTQTSTVLWTRSSEPGNITFEYSTDPNFATIEATRSVLAIDPEVPVRVQLDDLTPGTDYYYRVTAPDGEVATGEFTTANPSGTRDGLRFGVSGDLQGALAPFVALKNADDRDLDFFVQMGDMVEADSETPVLPDISQASSLEEFRLKQNEIYAQRFGLNTWTDLRQSTTVYGTWDDHEITRKGRELESRVFLKYG
jgi:hypothetical protein